MKGDRRMMKLLKTSWASSLACLAIVALAVGAAVAQQQDEPQQSSDQQNPSFLQSDAQSDQQSQEQQPPSQESTQEEWEQPGQQGEQPWPAPSREQFAEQPGQRPQAELGVNFAQTGAEGVTVLRVRPGSAADEMGIEPNDRITQVNGQPVQSEQQFIGQIRNMQPGEEVQLTIMRGGQEQTPSGQLQARQQSLMLGGPSGRDIAQSGYQEERPSETRSTRSGQISSQRLEELERQVAQLRQQLDDLRSALRDLREQSGLPASRGETTARYDQLQDAVGAQQRRQAERWGGRNRYGQSDTTRQRQRQFGVGQQGQRQSQPGQQGQPAQPAQQGQQPSPSGQQPSGTAAPQGQR
jgi:hypothetical protein